MAGGIGWVPKRVKMRPQKGPTGPETRAKQPMRLWIPNTRRGYTYARDSR